MPEQIESLRREITELRGALAGMQASVQSFAVNMATFTQTLLGEQQNRQRDFAYIEDVASSIKEVQGTLRDIEKWKARQEGSFKTVIALGLSGSSLIAFIITIIVMIVFKK